MSTYRRLMMTNIIPDNEIWYYAAEKVTLYTSKGVLSHEFSDDKGVIVLSGSANTVGEQLSGTAITDVDFPACVTSIGVKAFYNCTNLALTSLPSGVTSINDLAFYNCKNLALTELPDVVTIIGSRTFYNCKNLALTSLPSGVEYLEYAVFSGCTNLALTELPSGLTGIGREAFRGCTSLALTELPASVTNIGRRAFSGCTGIPYLHILDQDVVTLLEYMHFEGTSFIIYVGDGSSEKHDNQVLRSYLADPAWEVYEARLDTWYNHENI